MPDADPGASHWEVTLSDVDDDARYMTFVFTMGSALTGPPSLYDVLSTLAAEANMMESGELDTFADYCAAFGYDTDSRKAYAEWERIHVAVREQTFDLGYVLSGHEGRFEALLADEDVQ